MNSHSPDKAAILVAPSKSQFDTSSARRLWDILLAGFSLLLVGVFVFGNFLLLDKLLLYKDVGADSVNDTYPYFVHLSDYIRHERLPSWSFYVGMGQSLFYFTGNLIWEPVIWLPREVIAHALVYQHLFKTLIAGLLFFRFSHAASALITLAYLFAFLGLAEERRWKIYVSAVFLGLSVNVRIPSVFFAPLLLSIRPEAVALVERGLHQALPVYAVFVSTEEMTNQQSRLPHSAGPSVDCYQKFSCRGDYFAAYPSTLRLACRM